MIVTFVGCARCDGDGHELDFTKFLRPVEVGDVVFSHWALCPETGEPILLAVTDTKEEET